MLRLASRHRYRSLSRLIVRMSSTDAYLVPLDPKSPQSHPSISPPDLWASARPKDKAGETRLFYDVDKNGSLAALVSLGLNPGSGSASLQSEAIRKAVGIGAKKLKEAGAKSIAVDPKGDPHAAGSAFLSSLRP